MTEHVAPVEGVRKVMAWSSNLPFKRAADIDLDVLRELVGRAQDLAPSQA